MIEFQPSQVARTITLDGPLSRPVSAFAVLTVVAAVAGLGGFVHPVACFASFISCCFGGLAVSQVRRYEFSESSRMLLAMGMSTAVLTLVLAPAWHLLMYRSEALPGYQRVTFVELFTSVGPAPRPSDSISYYAPDDEQESSVVSDDRGVGDSGQRICLKGYVYPTGAADGLTEFLLTADGSGLHGQYVGVILAAGTTWDWTKEGVAVSGMLELNPEYTAGSDRETRYILKEASVRPARTSYGMKHRSRSGGC